jgi:hypothetical protein
VEYDCEIFDDGEAALDALLGQAQWEEPAMTERLTALIVDSAVPLPAAPVPVAQVELEAICSTGFQPVSAPVHGLETRATEDAPLILVPRTQSSRFNWRVLALAACMVLSFGVAWMLVQRALKPQTNVVVVTKSVEKSLPGREPNPYERWVISPAFAKRQASAAKPTSIVDPHAEQIESLCRTADARGLAAALVREQDEGARSEIFDALLSRPDGMERYLDLVLSSATRTRALNVLHLSSHPPTHALLAQLDSPSVARRFAAAKALGEICHGQTLPQLKRMIERSDHRREALAVLSQCKDAAAEQYVKEIRRQPSLGSEFNVVTKEMAELF